MQVRIYGLKYITNVFAIFYHLNWIYTFPKLNGYFNKNKRRVLFLHLYKDTQILISVLKTFVKDLN